MNLFAPNISLICTWWLYYSLTDLEIHIFWNLQTTVLFLIPVVLIFVIFLVFKFQLFVTLKKIHVPLSRYFDINFISYRSSHPKVFCRKGTLKSSTNFTVLTRVSIFNSVITEAVLGLLQHPRWGALW